MKKFFTFLIALVCVFSTSSCIGAYAMTQDEYGDNIVTISTVVRYGIPMYDDGVIVCYRYNDLFYYPYVLNNHWYVRPYRCMQPRGFRPTPPPTNHIGSPRPMQPTQRHNPSIGGRPQQNRMTPPNGTRMSSTRHTVGVPNQSHQTQSHGNGHFGGRR